MEDKLYRRNVSTSYKFDAVAPMLGDGSGVGVFKGKNT